MAQIKYLDSRRIMGESDGTDIAPTFEDDFSSDNWTDATGDTGVNTTTGKFEFDLARTTTNQSSYVDIGSTVSDTEWILRIHDLKITTKSGGIEVFIGISSNTSGATTAQDFIGVAFGDNTANPLAYGVDADNSSITRIGGDYTYTTNTSYYVEVIRTSPTNYDVKIYSDSNFSSLLFSQSYTCTSTTISLRYLKVANAMASGSTEDLVGSFDKITLFDGVTSVTTGKPKAPLSLSGCKAYYNFEQTSGSLTNIATTANGFADGLGSSADGTNNGATTGVTGKVGSYAWDFDGTNDYVELTSSTSNWNFLHNGGSHSYSYWIKLGNTGGIPEYLLFDISWSGDIGIAMTVNSSDQIQYSIYRGASGTWVVSGASSTSLDTNWHHVAITYDGSNARIYIDGSLDSTIAKTANAPSSSNSTYSLKIGATADITSFADVSLDELAIFNRVLTADEISALYNGGTGVAVNDSSILAKPETNSIFVETDGGRKYLFDGSEWYLTLKGGSGYATRAVFSGGFTGSESNTIDYVTIQTTGNATDFGDLVYARHYVGATSDTSRGVTTGGFDGTSTYSTIDYYTIATPANAQTFGSLTIGKSTYDSCVCDSVNVLQFGGYTGATATATIDYFGIRSLGNASTFGNLATALYAKFGLDDTFRAVTGGGGGYNTVIDYVTMRTPSNSTSFGNLTQGRGWSGATASTTRGVIGGGDSGSVSNVIDYVTIQTTGNATDFGDLSVARAYLSATGDRSRGLFGGGSSDYTNGNNTMDYITISTTGNATDFGDLTVARFGVAGCSGK